MVVVKAFDQDGSHLEIAKERLGDELQYNVSVDGRVIGTLATINIDAMVNGELEDYVDVEGVILEEIERSIKRIHRLRILPSAKKLDATANNIRRQSV